MWHPYFRFLYEKKFVNQFPPIAGDIHPGARLRFCLWLALACYLWILPVGGTTALRNLLFLLLLIFFSLLEGSRWRHLDRLLWQPWLLYGTTILVSLSYAVLPAYSLVEMKAEYAYPLLLFWLGLNLVRGVAGYSRLLSLLAVGNFFLVSYSLWISAIGGSTKDGLVGTLNAGVGTYSTYLITVMPLIALLAYQRWSQQRRWLAGGLAVLLGAGLLSLYFTFNRQGLLVLVADVLTVVGILACRGLSRKKGAILGGILLLLLGLFYLASQYRDPANVRADNATSGLSKSVKSDVRWHLWQFTGQKIAEKPWSGGGFGIQAFKLQFPDFEPGSMLWHAHNMVLNKGVQMGVPGMLAFLLLFFSVPAAMGRHLKGASPLNLVALTGIVMVQGVFLKNMTDDFFNRDCVYLFWLLSGATLGCLRGEAERNEGNA